MKSSAIIGLIWLVLAAPALGQSKSSSNAPGNSAQSKTSLAEVRAIVHELEGHTETLRELLANHRSLVEQKPQSGAEQLAKWDAAMERLLVRIESAHAVVVATIQRLDKAIVGELPTGLGKDVARVRNEADPERAMAEQALAKRKPASARKSKQASEKPARQNNEDIDL